MQHNTHSDNPNKFSGEPIKVYALNTSGHWLKPDAEAVYIAMHKTGLC